MTKQSVFIVYSEGNIGNHSFTLCTSAPAFFSHGWLWHSTKQKCRTSLCETSI